MKRKINHLLAFLKKPQNLILLFFVVTLGYLVLFPLVCIVKDTFVVHASEVMRVKGSKIGDFTTYHWVKVFADKNSATIFYTPLLNTMKIALGACFVAISFGGSFAWLVTRTDLRWKGILTKLFMFPYIMPDD